MAARTAQARWRLALVAGISTFLLLVGSGVAYAWWSATATVGSTASAATVGVTQQLAQPFGLDTTYSSGSLVAAGTVTVTNTSSRNGTFTLSALAASATASGLPAAITVNAAVVASAGACTTTSTLTSPVTGTLSTTTPVSVSGAVAAGASALVCVRTSISSGSVGSFAGASLVGSLASSISVGTWTSASATQTYSQSVGSTTSYYPALGCTSSTWMASYTWSPTPYATTAYRLYVNNILVSNGADGWNSVVQLTSGNVPFGTNFPAGAASVRVTKVLTGGGEEVIGVGEVILGPENNRTYACGTAPQVPTTSTPTPTPTPTGTLPTSTFTSCGGNGTNYIVYGFTGPTSNQNLYTYKVYINDIFVTDYTNAYYPYIQLYTNQAPPVLIATYGSGSKVIEVKQSYNGGAWTRAAIGVITIAPSTNYLSCG